MPRKQVKVVIYDEENNTKEELWFDNLLFAGMEDIETQKIVSGTGGLFSPVTVSELLIHCTATGVKSTVERLIQDGQGDIVFNDKKHIHWLFKRGLDAGFGIGYSDGIGELDAMRLKVAKREIKRSLDDIKGNLH